MDDGAGFWGLVFIGVVIWGLGSFFGWWGPTNEEKLRTALQDANAQIEYCNQNIDQAKSSAWEDYSSMGDALDSLTGCETVSDPTKKQ